MWWRQPWVSSRAQISRGLAASTLALLGLCPETMMEGGWAGLLEDERPCEGELRPLANCQHQCQTCEWGHLEFPGSGDSLVLVSQPQHYWYLVPVYYRMFCIISGLYLLDESSTHRQCLQTFPSVPWVERSPLVENCCSSWMQLHKWVQGEPAKERSSQPTKSWKVINCCCFKPSRFGWSVLQG